MSCDFAHLDGSYVLGALPPGERLEFEQHLADCPGCARAVRELAGLPGLLSRVDPVVLEDPAPDRPVPDTLLPRLLDAVRRRRRRRSLATTAVAAAVTVVAVGSLVVTRAGDTDAPSAGGPSTGAVSTSPGGHRMTTIGHAPVRASLALRPVAWGTRLDLVCTYAPAADRYDLPQTATYALVVRTRDGRTEQVGTWRSARGRTMRLTAATSAPRGDIASVEVRTTDGHRVLELTS
jgi:hypothetical protein